MRALALAICLFSTVMAHPVRSQPVAAGRGSGPAQSGARFDPRSIDDYLQDVVRNGRIPGVSVAVVLDGKVVLARGYGEANVELSAPATEDTVFQLASVTKTFTATGIMMLVEDGRIGLDDRITD